MDKNLKEKETTIKYYALTPDEDKNMKCFFEFKQLKDKLATPIVETRPRVIIKDEESAQQFLFQTNYYDFSIYTKCLPEKSDSEFVFQDCIELYDFNSFLQENLMKFTGKIELLIKSTIIHTLCSNYSGELQDGECYLDRSIYKNDNQYIELIERIGTRLYNSSSKSLPVSHHVENKNCKFPLWVVIPELTFGETTKLIESLNDDFYELWIKELFLSNDYYKKEDDSVKKHIIAASKSWISAAWFIRNVCAHYGRLYAKYFNVAVPKFYSPIFREIKKIGKKRNDNKDLFAFMLAIKQILICHNSSVHNQWNIFIREIYEKIENSNIIETTKIGFPEIWEKYLLINL